MCLVNGRILHTYFCNEFYLGEISESKFVIRKFVISEIGNGPGGQGSVDFETLGRRSKSVGASKNSFFFRGLYREL